ncbi:MAG TPA: hypothetical protein VGQ21_14960 [Thermoanaerobaculia bacterium]|jgi:hypothetical protein|nr:hypothetical protein [Thermoanaerobaculia bacterium]
MATQLVFLTLFLGLISGPQRIDLQPGPAVKSIHILLDGKQVAALQKEPWSVTVDFGPSIAPGDLVAIGYDARGDEVARASQSVNLPRPLADFVISVKNDINGRPVSAELRWEHLMAAKPAKSSLKIDGKVVPLDGDLHAKLPRLDVNQPHVLAASMRFEDGFVSRRELVIGGGVGDTADSPLTPVAVREAGGRMPPNRGSCFVSGGSPVRVSAIEKGRALVIVVLDPDPRDAMKALDLRMSPAMMQGPHIVQEQHLFSLSNDTWLQLLWPLAERHTSTSNMSAVMFPPSTYVEAAQGGMMWLLTRAYSGRVDENAPRMFADAAGVAGLDAITGGNRRAVVVVLNHRNDGSSHDPASIRGYLSTIGVPLYVWSLTGPRPLEAGWGEIDDISSPAKLKIVAERLRADLDSQRVAWLATDGVAALRVQATGRCSLTPLAHRP